MNKLVRTSLCGLVLGLGIAGRASSDPGQEIGWKAEQGNTGWEQHWVYNKDNMAVVDGLRNPSKNENYSWPRNDLTKTVMVESNQPVIVSSHITKWESYKSMQKQLKQYEGKKIPDKTADLALKVYKTWAAELETSNRGGVDGVWIELFDKNIRDWEVYARNAFLGKDKNEITLRVKKALNLNQNKAKEYFMRNWPEGLRAEYGIK